MHVLLDFFQRYPSFVMALAVFIPFAILWNYLRRRKVRTQQLDSSPKPKPLPLSLGLINHVKAFISWVFLFMRTFSVKPGLYFTGEQNENAPLLVTANNFLTVFLLARRIGGRSVRILVVNTDSINVWCSAAKGRFSAGEIIDTANRCGLLREGQKIHMILPKLCLSGVNLAELQQAGIRPSIGPIYAKDVPHYLDEGKFPDRVDDRIRFGLQSRTFTALPTAVQFFYYFLGVYVFLFWTVDTSIIWIATGLAFFYPILSPFLPGKQFAVKGISLAFLVSFLPAGLFFAGKLNIRLASFLIIFFFATTIFIALSYTGNSAVSNYSRVRKEIARFLPIVVLLYMMIIPITIFL